MKNKILGIILLVLTIISLVGCSSESGSSNSGYQTITATEAKKMMDENADIIILDVRTAEEFNTGSIKGALLIPDNEINQKAEEVLKDKEATILVYCRSGRRSAVAAKALSELGYTNIYDFGGINDWTYEITK